jgi:hypothetical protein
MPGLRSSRLLQLTVCFETFDNIPLEVISNPLDHDGLDLLVSSLDFTSGLLLEGLDTWESNLLNLYETMKPFHV